MHVSWLLCVGVLATAQWYPSDNAVWGGVCESGTRQSPVSILDVAVERANSLTDEMTYPTPVTYTSTDGTYGLEYTSSETMGTFDMSGTSYELKQFNLHTGSEHRINGIHNDLELQFVYESAPSSHHVTGVAMVAILCNEVDDSDSSLSSAEADFWNSLQNGNALNLNTLFDSINTKKYYQYEGSFTTPGCEEGVQWTVMGDVCSVPTSFLTYTQTLASMTNNYRSTQLSNGRQIDNGAVVVEAAGDEEEEESAEKGKGVIIGCAFTGLMICVCIGVVAFIRMNAEDEEDGGHKKKRRKGRGGDASMSWSTWDEESQMESSSDYDVQMSRTARKGGRRAPKFNPTRRGTLPGQQGCHGALTTKMPKGGEQSSRYNRLNDAPPQTKRNSIVLAANAITGLIEGKPKKSSRDGDCAPAVGGKRNSLILGANALLGMISKSDLEDEKSGNEVEPEKKRERLPSRPRKKEAHTQGKRSSLVLAANTISNLLNPGQNKPKTPSPYRQATEADQKRRAPKTGREHNQAKRSSIVGGTAVFGMFDENEKKKKAEEKSRKDAIKAAKENERQRKIAEKDARIERARREEHEREKMESRKRSASDGPSRNAAPAVGGKRSSLILAHNSILSLLEKDKQKNKN